MVLMAVLFFVLLATASVASFVARATVDGMAASNRDNAARAEALARGGVRLAEALLLMDRLAEQRNQFEADTSQDAWAVLSGVPVPGIEDGGELRVKVEDAGAKLPLNALFSKGAVRNEKTEIFLGELLTKVIDEIPVRPEQKLYDVQESGPQPDRLGRRRLRPRRRRGRGRVLPEAAPALPAGEPQPALGGRAAADRGLRRPARERAPPLRGRAALREGRRHQPEHRAALGAGPALSRAARLRAARAGRRGAPNPRHPRAEGHPVQGRGEQPPVHARPRSHRR